MLKTLSIQNFVIIEHSEIPFTEGFNVITGETGAGKSILLGALSLILGNRADKKTILDKSQKTIIEATFLLKDENQFEFFKTYDIDFEQETIIRREISPNGKSRAFINDSPVKLDGLKELTSQLVDLHRQHESLSIASNHFQREVIDIFAEIRPEVNRFGNEFKLYQLAKQELEHKKEQEASLVKEQDFIAFQVQELEEANLQLGELESIEHKLSILQNQEEIYRRTENIATLLQNDSGAISLLNHALIELRELQKIQPIHDELLARLDSVLIELEDIDQQISLGNIQELEAEDIDLLTSRLDNLNRLMSKHLAKNEEELLAVFDEMQAKMTQFSSLAEDIEALTKKIEKQEIDLLRKATILSNKRQQVCAEIENKVTETLKQIGLPNATFKIQIHEKELTAVGKDRVSMLFSANAGQAAQEIKDAASGGEIARLMLAIKSLIADKTTLSTMIFDEIDTGISGEVAQKVGSLLANLASNQQIISVTHLPQIASKGNHHIKIYKEEMNNQTRSNVAVLNQEKRINEIAEMLSGANPSERALEAAKELVEMYPN